MRDAYERFAPTVASVRVIERNETVFGPSFETERTYLGIFVSGASPDGELYALVPGRIRTESHKRVEIDRLSNQHAKFLEMLEMARLHALGCSPAEARSLGTDLEAFLQMFRKHEWDEELLLELAIKKEAGALDSSLARQLREAQDLLGDASQRNGHSFLGRDAQRFISQIQGRSYANMTGMVERFEESSGNENVIEMADQAFARMLGFTYRPADEVFA